jgi:hypothetical protein
MSGFCGVEWALERSDFVATILSVWLAARTMANEDSKQLREAQRVKTGFARYVGLLGQEES